MSFIDFIQTNIFVTILTLSITLATCIIDKVHSYRKMKIENFSDIYKCLDEFAKERSKVLDRCKKISDELAQSIPKEWNGKTQNEYMKKYDSSYNGINKIISEYSKILDFFLSFTHFLYNNKPIMPIIKTECWSILNLYELLITMECNTGMYQIKYSQIVSIVQFIRLSGKKEDKKRLMEYLKQNHISEFD